MISFNIRSLIRKLIAVLILVVRGEGLGRHLRSFHVECSIDGQKYKTRAIKGRGKKQDYVEWNEVFQQYVFVAK